MAILEKLLRLQDIDREIARWKESRTRSLKKLQRPPNEINQVQQSLRQLSEDIKRRRQKILEMQSTVSHRTQQISKREEQLNDVKNMEEYKVMTQEIEKWRSEKENLEMQILTKTEQDEAATKLYQEQKQKLAAMEKQAALLKQQLEKEIQECDQQIGQLQENRKQYCTEFTTIDKETEVLDQYERILSRGGFALLPVEDNSCGHCHIELLPNQTAEILTGKIITCKDCFRMLYWPKS